jgi:hypothetical protein
MKYHNDIQSGLYLPNHYRRPSPFDKVHLQWFANLVDINGEDPGLEVGGTPWEFTSIDDDGGTNTFELSAAAALSGSFGYISSFAGGGDAYGKKTFSETLDVFARFNFKIVSYAGGDDDSFYGFGLNDNATGLAVQMRFYRTATADTFGYRLYVNNGGDVALDNPNDNLFVVGTTYCIEVNYLSDALVGGAELFINGASHDSNFTLNTATYDADELYIGPWSGVLANGDIFYYDDIVVADAYIGPIVAGGSMVPILANQNRRRRL